MPHRVTKRDIDRLRERLEAEREDFPNLHRILTRHLPDDYDPAAAPEEEPERDE